MDTTGKVGNVIDGFMPGFSFKIASTEEEIRVSKNIRQKVFVDEQGIPSELDNDGDDAGSIHLLAFDLADRCFIGTGRLTINGQKGNLSRICVLNPFRKSGVGKLLVMELESIARQKGIHQLTLTPHDYLEKFYESLGYRKEDGDVEVAGYKLLFMSKSM